MYLIDYEYFMIILIIKYNLQLHQKRVFLFCSEKIEKNVSQHF